MNLQRTKWSITGYQERKKNEERNKQGECKLQERKLRKTERQKEERFLHLLSLTEFPFGASPSSISHEIILSLPPSLIATPVNIHLLIIQLPLLCVFMSLSKRCAAALHSHHPFLHWHLIPQCADTHTHTKQSMKSVA